jgi:hypothetical protein
LRDLPRLRRRNHATRGSHAGDAVTYCTRPLRRQVLPLEVQPRGHAPFMGFGIASCARGDGIQNAPLDM